MAKFVVTMRALMVALIVIALIATLTDTSGLVPDSYFDLASYYTFQTNIVCAAVLTVLLWHSYRGTTPARWLEYGRAFCAVNLVVVAIIYWSTIFPLGTEDGAQMTLVMVISHIATPLYIGVEYMMVGTREPLPLAQWWVIAGYAGVWTAATVARSAQGNYVAYDHLDPAIGYASVASNVALHSAILLTVTVVAMRIRRYRTMVEPARHTGDDVREPRLVTARHM
jgi:hypothetical protein